MSGLFSAKPPITTEATSYDDFSPTKQLLAESSLSPTQSLVSFFTAAESEPMFEVDSLIFVLVDAMRPDFVFPVDQPSRNYHNVFTSLARTNASSPDRTVFEVAYSDPPTVTL